MLEDWSTWKLIYWLLGTIGVAGTIIIAAIFPAAFSVALRAVAGFFNLLLSYRAGCALLAAIAAAIAADYWRHSHEDEKHRAEVAAFERKQDERDARIKQETRESVLAEIASATKENAATDTVTKEFTDALPKTDDMFRVGDAACRLRRIAGQGQAECGPDDAERVSSADADHAGGTDHRKNRLPSLIRGIARRHQQGQQGHRTQEQLR